MRSIADTSKTAERTVIVGKMAFGALGDQESRSNVYPHKEESLVWGSANLESASSGAALNLKFRERVFAGQFAHRTHASNWVDAECARFENYLDDDWDGEGAAGVSRITLSRAHNTLSELAPEVPRAKLNPGSVGEIICQWLYGNELVSIEFLPHGQILVFYELNSLTPTEYRIDKDTSAASAAAEIGALVMSIKELRETRKPIGRDSSVSVWLSAAQGLVVIR